MGKRSRRLGCVLLACLTARCFDLRAQSPTAPVTPATPSVPAATSTPAATSPPAAISNPATPLSPGASPGPEVSAADLLREAGQAVDTNHLAEAHALLDRVKKLNETQGGLWATYAVLDLREKKADAAVLDFGKELTLHPDNYAVYNPLVATLLELNRRPEALRALRTWSAAAPADPRPVALQVRTLLEDGETQAAIKAAAEGLAHLPEGARNDPQLQYLLGGAELQAAEKAAGTKRLVTLLSETDDASLRNSIAYALADADVALPAAEATERQLLGRLELESEGWSLAAGAQPLRVGTPLLVAAWDTMGWILFREGKAAEAEPFVRASWRNEPHGTVGEHLSEIEAALGQKSAALGDLGMAVAAAKAAPGQGGAAQGELTATEARLLALRTSAAGAAQPSKGAVLDSPAALHHLLTFSLGPSAGRSGSALYAVLLSRGRVVASVPVSIAGKPWAGMNPLFAHADLSTLFPVPGTYVQLMHLVTVNCSPAGCEMVLGQP